MAGVSFQGSGKDNDGFSLAPGTWEGRIDHMRPFVALLIVSSWAALSAPAQVYWPRGQDWQARSPVEAGLDPAAIEDALRFAGARNSTGVAIIYQGRIVAERYWQNWNQETSASIFSASKSVASTLVGMAIEEEKIKGVEQSVADFIPSWKGTPKAIITVRHLLSMTSGLKNTPGGAPQPGTNAFEQTAALPLQYQPGEHWDYNTPAYRMLLHILELATGEALPQYTWRKLTGPLEMTKSEWNGRPATDKLMNWTWFQCSVRDMARFGLLVLRHGQWQDKQLVSEKYLREAATPSQKLNQAYGYLWWLNGARSYRLPASPDVRQGPLWPDVPPDAFAALGAQDKKIYIVPSLDLVVVRHGGAAGVGRNDAVSSFDNQFLGRICKAVKR